MKTKKTYAVLTKDWAYTAFNGQKVAWPKGRRFLLNRKAWFDGKGDLVLESWFCYGADAIIPAEYFAKN